MTGEILVTEGRSGTEMANGLTAPAGPLITIVTAVLNGARYLEQAILSVLNQSYDNVEYIIIDGGSTDGTLQIIEKYEAELGYWSTEADKGIYDAMNKGILLARGEVIGLLNADDFYEPDALSKVAEWYSASDRQSISYGNNYVLQEDLHLKYKSYPHMRYWVGMPVCHQAMFVPRSVYQKIGAYTLNYTFASDYDFLLRTIRAGITYVHLDVFLVNYRDTGLTSMHYAESLSEAKSINGSCFPPFSRARVNFLLSYWKTMTLFHLQRVIGAFCGIKVLQVLRAAYLKKFIAKEHEWV